jgi:multimeric flavodoxin WrbA
MRLEYSVMAPTSTVDSHFVMLLASARSGGNAETLARHAAAALSADTRQTWLRLSDNPLPPFEDRRHVGDGAYPAPVGHGRTLVDATLAATDLVFVVPLYWYGLPASAKLVLDHWSGWMRVPDLAFKARMAGKTLWAISAYSDTDPKTAQPLFDTLRLTAGYMNMRYGGELLGYGNQPGDVLRDAEALARACHLFSEKG